ncbi:MAG: ABC transporter substrate-binding protein [Pseudomonadota bacterium]|nr:ABC transporter substrate-binding protein [Pseudomonadota bacterium]
MRLIFALVFLTILALAPSLRADETPAQAAVQSLHDALLDVMQAADALGFDGRRDYLEPVMSEVFDMPVIARVSVGSHWRKAAAPDKQRLVAMIFRLSVSTYAARFDGFSGESFAILAEEPAPRDTRMVRTEIVKADGDTVRLDYLLHESDNGWRIVDVYLDGVYSELALRRADYASTLKSGGFDALFTQLEKKIEIIEAEER